MPKSVAGNAILEANEQGNCIPEKGIRRSLLPELFGNIYKPVSDLFT
jgi:hypothetical protein